MNLSQKLVLVLIDDSSHCRINELAKRRSHSITVPVESKVVTSKTMQVSQEGCESYYFRFGMSDSFFPKQQYPLRNMCSASSSTQNSKTCPPLLHPSLHKQANLSISMRSWKTKPNGANATHCQEKRQKALTKTKSVLPRHLRNPSINPDLESLDWKQTPPVQTHASSPPAHIKLQLNCFIQVRSWHGFRILMTRTIRFAKKWKNQEAMIEAVDYHKKRRNQEHYCQRHG